jgi:flagellar basal body rod protein FlgB
MLDRLLGADSTIAAVRDGLDRSTATVRGVASRIAGAGANDGTSFARTLDGAEAKAAGNEVDLEAEMVALAEEQIRFDAQARMLEKLYERVRLSVRGG